MPSPIIQYKKPAAGINLRDFSKGRITKYSVNPHLIAQNFPNSVSNSVNINFDTIVGSGVVRAGTTLLGSAVSSGKTPLGLTNFVGTSGTPNLVISVFQGASNASLYYYDTSWHTSALTSLSNTAKTRFAQIGGRIFKVNGTDQMLSSIDGNAWNSTNSITIAGVTTTGIAIPGVRPALIIRSKQRLLLAGDATYKDRIFFSSVISPFASAKAVSVTLTASGTLATGTTSADHGFSIGEYITIVGANQSAYNGSFIVVSTSTTKTFDYAMTTSPVSPATGTITVYPSEISYNSDKLLGDWIDVNPDDGSNITAFAETSNQLIVFKTNGMYRLDVINKTVDSQNIFNIGAISQEGVVSCQGIVYFYSGLDIRSTDGTYPTQISRFGVQDFIDAIPPANQSSVCAGTDGLNVYFSIGDITLNSGKTGQKSYSKVVLKYSPRDQSWSVHSYAQQPLFYTQYTSSTAGKTMLSVDATGSVQTVNSGFTDNGTERFFFLETQEQDFSVKANTKGYQDLIAVYTDDGGESSLQVKTDESDYSDVPNNLPDRVNIVNDFTFLGHSATFKWFGSTSTSFPRFEGIYIPQVIDEGMDRNG